MQVKGGAMDVGSGAAVTFNGNSNVMQSNTAPINKGKSISSISANLKFIICHPGNTNTPKTYTGLYPGDKIEDDLDKCDADIITCYQYIKDICECWSVSEETYCSVIGSINTAKRTKHSMPPHCLIISFIVLPRIAIDANTPTPSILTGRDNKIIIHVSIEIMHQH